MKKTFFILTVMALLVCNSIFGQNGLHILNMQFEGKKFDYLKLNVMVESKNRPLAIEGKSENGYNWQFEIPKSIVDSISWIRLITGKFNSTDTTLYQGEFIRINDIDTLLTLDLPANEKNNIIYNFKYLKSEKTQVEMALMVDTVFYPYFISVTDIFVVINLDGNSELALNLEYNHFGLIDKYKDYDSQVQNCFYAVRRHPDSQYLISNLYFWNGSFKSKEDVIKIYNCFSEKNKQSFFGQLLQNYLFPKFENLKLPLLNNTNVFELLIQDSTKYNIIELTASWCVPCRTIVPILKEISEQYKDKLIITYVTTDESKTIDKFRELIVEEKYPWRCLWALYDNDKYPFNFGDKTIPKGVLVTPKGQVEIFNFNNPDDLVHLHRILDENK